MLVIFIHVGVVGRCCGYYGNGSAAIHFRQVNCSGSESSITSCSYFKNTVTRNLALDVGVECQQGQCVGYAEWHLMFDI